MEHYDVRLDLAIHVSYHIRIFFRIMSCLKCCIDFDTYFFYLYNFDIFKYSYGIHIIFRTIFL